MVKLSKVTHLEMFTKMERIREFDSRINKLVRRGFVQGMTHFSVGEEAANVGAVQHLSYDDIFFSNHRGHGQSIAQDMDLNKMMAVVVLCTWLTLKKVTMVLTVSLVVVTLLP